MSPAGKHNLLVNCCFAFPNQEAFEFPMIDNCKELMNLLKKLMCPLKVCQTGLHLQDCLRLKAVGESFVGEDTHWLQQLIIVTVLCLVHSVRFPLKRASHWLLVLALQSTAHGILCSRD